ncbi:MAG: NAD+ synthase [Methanomicrobiales archaeon]|nr:NAD+ synthase [Methanomicrobiales archaeon]
MQSEASCEVERIEQMIRHVLWRSGSAGVVVGLSGGVDSALAASLCVGALGKEKVRGFILPAAVSREEDTRDAQNFCDILGITCRTIAIQPILDTFREAISSGTNTHLEGNLMARIRMALLYFEANRENLLVCGTSNRSEYMLGYCTKFGDNAADLQPLLHLYKTEVYELACRRGIPAQILSKPPSAGLWVGQTDEEEIGLRYAEIDRALQSLERNAWVPAYPVEEKVLKMVQRSQHKRNPPFNLLFSP